MLHTQRSGWCKRRRSKESESSVTGVVVGIYVVRQWAIKPNRRGGVPSQGLESSGSETSYLGHE